MKAFLIPPGVEPGMLRFRGEEAVIVLARAEGEDGAVGDLREEILPGESWGPYSYDELVDHGVGAIEMTPSAATA